MSESIGILTGGGDCPGLNAVIRAVVKTATKSGWKTIGFKGGFEGLLSMDCEVLNYKSMDALLVRGGTILGTSNKGSFSVKTGIGQIGKLDPKVVSQTLENFKKLGLKALVVVGGDGSLSIAQQLFEAGIPIVGVPKTIDNDLSGTDSTFGFDSAVSCGMDALDRLHTTAESHNRVLILELMGRYAGWITLWAGISGGADVILLPEIPFNYESICAKIEEREKNGKHFTIIAVAEGARLQGGDYVLTGKQEKNREARLGGISHRIADEISERTGKECRVCILGHLQRGGSPSSTDRMLCTVFGSYAVNLIAEGHFGQMVAIRNSKVTSIEMKDAIGKLRVIDKNSPLIKIARSMSISLGDEIEVNN